MRRFTIIIAIAIVAISIFGCLIGFYRTTSPSGNTSANNDADSDRPYIDTIMCTRGHAFGYSGDITVWDGWYLDSVKVGDDLMLEYDSVGPSALRLSLVTRDITVDLSSDNAAKAIRDFLGPIEGFRRYQKKYEVCIDSVVDEKYGLLKCTAYYSFTADYAEPGTANASALNKFMCDLTYIPSEVIAGNSTKGHEDIAAAMPALSDYMLNRMIKYWKEEDDLSYLWSVGADIAVSAHIVNPKFATYGVYSYDRSGSGHGMYTKTFHTLDVESGEIMSNNNIFKPNSLADVRSALIDVMAEDPRSDGWNMDQDLPQGALTDSGVVFSFQPYEIDCWAAGTLHFIVPYRTLMPYLTPKAKDLIKGCDSRAGRQ